MENIDQFEPVVLWRNQIARYLSKFTTAITLIDIEINIPRLSNIPEHVALEFILQQDPFERFAVSGSGETTRARRIYRVDDSEIKPFVAEWQDNLAEYLSGQGVCISLSDLGSQVSRPASVPISVKLIDVLKTDPSNRFIISTDANGGAKAQYNFSNLSEEQLASLRDQWRDNVSRFLSNYTTSLSIQDIANYVTKPPYLDDSVTLYDILRSDKNGCFAISGDFPNIRVRRVYRVDDPAIAQYVEEWRASVALFLCSHSVSVSLSDIGSSISRPSNLPASVKLIDVLRADEQQRFVLSGDGNNIRAALSTSARQKIVSPALTQFSTHFGLGAVGMGYTYEEFAYGHNDMQHVGRYGYNIDPTYRRGQDDLKISPQSSTLRGASANIQYRNLTSSQHQYSQYYNFSCTTSPKFGSARLPSSIPLPQSGSMSPTSSRSMNSLLPHDSATESNTSQSSLIDSDRIADVPFPTLMAASNDTLHQYKSPSHLVPSLNISVQESNVDFADLSIPAEFCCPISRQIMKDPVVCSDGITYDKCSIDSIVFSKSSSLNISNPDKAYSIVRYNDSLKSAIGRYLGRRGKTSHQEDNPSFSILGNHRLGVGLLSNLGVSNAAKSSYGMIKGSVISDNNSVAGISTTTVPPLGLLKHPAQDKTLNSMSSQSLMSLSSSSLSSPTSSTKSSMGSFFGPNSCFDGNLSLFSLGTDVASSTSLCDLATSLASDSLSCYSINSAFSESGSNTTISTGIFNSTPCHRDDNRNLSTLTQSVDSWMRNVFAGFDSDLIDHFCDKFRDEAGFATVADLLEAFSRGQLTFDFLSRLGFKLGHFNRLSKALDALSKAMSN